MILNGVMAVILRYFTEFGSFCGRLHQINLCMVKFKIAYL